MPNVVRSLCKSKCNTSAIDGQGDCALWSALTAGQEDIASILVQKKMTGRNKFCTIYDVFQVENGCDVNFWSPGPNGCMQTILHRSIDENNETAACFLIRRLIFVRLFRFSQKNTVSLNFKHVRRQRHAKTRSKRRGKRRSKRKTNAITYGGVVGVGENARRFDRTWRQRKCSGNKKKVRF